MAVKEFAKNFAIGGFLIALALWLAYATNPFIGGIIAALPVRYAITWGMAGAKQGEDFAEKMAKGSIRGMIGNLCFTITIILSLVALGLVWGFALAIAVCLAVILALKRI